MSIQIFNTLSGKKEVFEPLHSGKVGIYVCGPTVYDLSHMGHARAYVAFDTVVRFLRRYYDVTYVRNYTDVDDKIIKRAQEWEDTSEAVSERYIKAFRDDMAALGVAPADVEPRVTQHIPQIIALIERLITVGAAYPSAGDVYYAVDQFAHYGCLAKRAREDMEAGARVEIGERKRNPLDFALWKAAKPGEPFWESPWGQGRPGWHIECSAMSAQHLGVTFDIHGGGKDLIFPHHENEIAQSEAASGKQFARYWMHNGFVNIDNEKMSKSLGNFFTIRDILARFDAQTIRFYLLTTHYRSPINFSDQALAEAEARITYLYKTVARMDQMLVAAGCAIGADAVVMPGPYRAPWVAEVVTRFEQAMQDDFNTPKVLGDLSDAFKLANEIIDQATAAQKALAPSDVATLSTLRAALHEIGDVIGILNESPDVVLGRLQASRVDMLGVDQATVERLLAERQQARVDRNFARSDAIRDELLAMSVVIKDGPTGTTWEVKTS